MKYYQDITLLPNVDVPLSFIWEKVYQQIHLLLVESKCAENQSSMGLSFPTYGDKTFPLGNQLRLLAENEDKLIQANLSKWLQRFRDYVHIKSIKAIPTEVNQYACFYRVNAKSQQRRLKQLDRRVAVLSEKHRVDEDEMRELLLRNIELNSLETKLPFINVKSLSSISNSEPHQFRLFIGREVVSDCSQTVNVFTCYGLSACDKGKPTLVPIF